MKEDGKGYWNMEIIDEKKFGKIESSEKNPRKIPTLSSTDTTLPAPKFELGI